MQYRGYNGACLGFKPQLGEVQAQATQPCTWHQHSRRRRSLRCQPVLLPHAHMPTVGFPFISVTCHTSSTRLMVPHARAVHLYGMCVLPDADCCNRSAGRASDDSIILRMWRHVHAPGSGSAALRRCGHRTARALAPPPLPNRAPNSSARTCSHNMPTRASTQSVHTFLCVACVSEGGEKAGIDRET